MEKEGITTRSAQRAAVVVENGGSASCLFPVEVLCLLFNPLAPQPCLLVYVPSFLIPRNRVGKEMGSSSLPSK